MREIAAALKLQASKVDDAIVDAAIKGLTTGPEIYKAVKEFLRKEVINRPCDDLLSTPVSLRSFILGYSTKHGIMCGIIVEILM